jgi:putative aldouronate transport system permease protein
MYTPNIDIPKCFNINLKRWTGIKYLLLSLPLVAFIAAFSYMPLYSWIYAFFNYKLGLQLSDMQFVGFDNFIKLYTERNEIFRVLRNTIIMSLLHILCTPLPVIFAIMLNEINIGKFRKITQTITTFPNFISWIVVFGLSFAMFSSSGFVTTVLANMGVKTSATGILGSNDWVWLFQLALSIWKGLGWSAIIYLAAISGIDTELYDAAKVDGANKVQSIMHVTVPGIIPTFLVLLLLSVSNLLNAGFDQYFVFYNSLVSDRIEVLDYYVYKIGILCSDYSYSVAIGMLKSLISVMLLFIVNGITKAIRGDSLV